MQHDRLHAREPTHDIDRWSGGVVESIGERDGHCVVTSSWAGGYRRGASPAGERVWYRVRGG